jgi:autotransporter-associated beta strand protein
MILNVNAGGAVIDTSGNDIVIPLILQSNSVAGGLVKLGGGSLILTASNNYAGPTIVSNGTVEVTYPTLAASAMVKIESGAAVKLDFATTNEVGSLVLNGATQSPGVYNATTTPSYITGAGSLMVTPPVNTDPTNITATVSGGVLTLSWPADHIGWRLQVQTNSLSAGLNTNWLDVAGSTNVNSVDININPANGSVFYRMIYP